MSPDLVSRALIVGGGPAGLTAAIALGRRGIASTVAEIDDAPRPVGIGLALQNSPLRALDELGLVDACSARGFVHQSVNICAPSGEVVHQITPEPLVAGKPAMVALSRVDLAAVMDEAFAALPDAEIRYGTTVDGLSDAGDHVEATFSDGTFDRFDLVLGADGLHSKVRALTMPEAPPPRPQGQLIWRASAPRPPEVDRYFIYDLGPLGRVGLVPISDHELYLWMLQPDDGTPRPAQDQVRDALRERLRPFAGHVPRVAEALRSEVDCRGLSALLVPAPWHRGRVLLIGDAAHTTTPHIAYGVGMAIEDSVVLADELAHAESVPEALDGFMARRWERCRLVVETSLQLSAWEVDPPDDPSLHHQLTGRALAALSAPL